MNELTHFAINAEDTAAAVRFYESVFGWEFERYGEHDFFRSQSAGPATCAIQGRRELIPGVRTTGFECTIEVDDVDRVAEAVLAAGGRVVMEKSAIPGVGEVVFFADPDGNVAGAIRFDAV
ncbi:MAG TPA: VOC family protein [Thermoleophilaceae bacterium]|jgi:predicted enzyme related to lactoylglutathione lyase